MLSIYQQRTIFRRMLHLAHFLTQQGMDRTVIMRQVGELRDQQVTMMLADIQVRQRRGHLH